MATETTIAAVTHVDTTRRRAALSTVLRATALLSSTSFLGIAVGLISSKCIAVLIGPAGFGFMGLAQSFLALATTIAGLGVSVALVRDGAKSASEHDDLTFAAIRRAASLLVAFSTAVALVVLLLFRAQLSRWMLGMPNGGPYVLLIGIALAFNVAAAVQVSVVNAHHRVKSLAKISVTTTLIGATITVLAVWAFGKAGILPAIILGSAAGWIIAKYVAVKEIERMSCQPSLPQLGRAARSLFQFGGTYTVSLLLGTGVQMVMPTLVLHRLGADNVGFYRAAISVSVSYLGFLLVAMAQDYYPRVSAAVDRPALLADLIDRQQQLVLLITVPVILGALALAPYIVPLVFTAQFAPTIAVLEWHLIGDLFKFTSWTMSYVIMARCRSRVFLFTESVAGGTMLVGSWYGMTWFGLPGLGMAFLATYVIYTATVWLIIRRQIPLKFSATNRWLMVYGVGAAASVRLLHSTPWTPYRTPVALLLSIIAAGLGLAVIRREFRDKPSLGGDILRSCLTKFRLSN